MKTLSKNQKGFGLIEILVALSVMMILVYGIISSVLMLGDTVKNSEIKSGFVSLGNDIDTALRNANVCGTMMRSSPGVPATYAPPANPAFAHAENVPQLYIGDDLIVAGPQSSLPDPNSKLFKVDRLQLVRVTGVPIGATTVMAGSPPAPVAVSKHLAKLELEITRTGGTLKGHKMKKSWLVDINVNGANQIIKCASQKDKPWIATARRSAITIEDTNCLEKIDKDLYMPNTCPDADDNNRCDDNVDGKPQLSDIEHPMRENKHSLWDQSFPKRKVGVNPLGPTQQEGRCIVSVRSNTSTETPDKIFLLYNSKWPGAEGIGCNSGNGWVAVSCMRSDYGVGDADTAMVPDTAGNLYCVTGDHTQPHLVRAFAVQAVYQTVVCMKYPE